MKKSLMVMSLLLCSVFMVTGCGNNSGEVDESKYSVYEWHEYDVDYKHTEEMILKYNEDGSLAYAEYYWVRDNATSCDYANKVYDESEDKNYPDVKYTCEISDGKMTTKWSMTEKSLEKGYLTDEKDYDSTLKNWYDRIKDETVGKALMERQVTRFREDSLFGADERNYIIIDGERIDS